MEMRHVLQRGLISCAFILFPAVKAFAQCETSVTIAPDWLRLKAPGSDAIEERKHSPGEQRGGIGDI